MVVLADNDFSGRTGSVVERCFPGSGARLDAISRGNLLFTTELPGLGGECL